MSYDSAGYHHRQYDLPQPRRATCWDPPWARQPTGYQQPPPHHPYQARQPTCWDPPWMRQTTTYQQFDGYEQQFQRPTSCWDPPHGRHQSQSSGYDRPQRVKMDYPEEYWDFDEYWDAVDSRRLSRPYLRHDPSSSSIPAAAAVPPPPPQRSPSCWSPTKHHRQAVSCLAQPTAVLQPLPQRSPSCWNPPSRHCSPTAPLPAAAAPPPADDSRRPPRLHLPSSMEKECEEFCYEIELIPSSHSSSLDQEADAHQKMEKNDSLNWMGSFLDEVDESKSSLLDDDNHENKATFDDDEFIEMEPQSVKLSDDMDLDLERESDSSSSPSCVDANNSSQQKCWDSDDEDGVDVLSQHQNLVQQMKMELKSCRIRGLPTISEELQQFQVLAQRFMEDDQFEGRRNDNYVRSLCIISETMVIFQEFVFGDKVSTCGGLIAKVDAQQHGLLLEVVSSLDKKGMRMKEQMRGEKCIVRKLRRHQERGLERILEFLSVIAFDPGGEISKLLLSSTLSVVSWFPP